ncbi:MAG: 50S ribosomal protein L30 [Alphaproteobacteria bacterium]|nr:MAG: 50S ribosomal protein L30 [Alphaproteobacteria bacterium]
MATKKKTAGGTVKVKRVGSPIRREFDQRATLVGLGLTRANKVVELEDTPSIQGMIRKVQHLVEVVK